MSDLKALLLACVTFAVILAVSKCNHASARDVHSHSPDALASSQSHREARAREFKIAIIDTGYDPTRATVPLKLCKTGHFDYFTQTSNINYVHPHGTWVANIIAEKLKDVNYCAVIFQVYPKSPDGKIQAPVGNISEALNRAIGEGVVAINMSIGSADETRGAPDASEEQAMKWAGQAGIGLFVAAGNNAEGSHGGNLDKACNVYPACYTGIKNMVVVGALSDDNLKEPATYSNYGKRVDVWAQGWYDDGKNAATGTSFAVPRALSEYVLYLDSHPKH